MIEITKEDAKGIHEAIAREGLVLSLCDAKGDVLGNMTRLDGTPVPAGLGDLSQGLAPDGSWFLAAHTELGALFLSMWQAGEV